MAEEKPKSRESEDAMTGRLLPIPNILRAIGELRQDQVLTLAIIAALGYLMWQGPLIITENNAIQTRALQEERERDRILAAERDSKYISAVQAEFERNRQSNDALAKLSRDSQADTVKLLVGSVQKLSGDMGKLEAKFTMLSATIEKLEASIQKLNEKLGNVAFIAPPPRVKATGS